MSAPLRLELALSSRSTCKTCRLHITQGDPRVGVDLQDTWSSVAWHHITCFNWKSHNISSEKDLEGIHGWANVPNAARQILISKLLSSGTSALLAVAGSKRAADAPHGASCPAKRHQQTPHLSQLEEQPPRSLGISYIEYAKAKKPSVSFRIVYCVRACPIFC